MNKITFYDAHYPVLEDGDYTFTFEQTLKLGTDKPTIPPNSVNFHVNGPRFALNSNHIVSTFPPNAGKGDFMAVLPTLVLDRSTLPWERHPLKGKNEDSVVKNSSWLFLLLVDESELEQITEQSNSILASNSPELDSNKDNTDALILSNIANSLNIEKDNVPILPQSINYLEVPSSFLSDSDGSLIPQTLNELQYLSYARIKGDSEEEHAVLLCNRLPKKGSNSTVYLISLENNYQTSDGKTFTFNGIKSNSNFVFPYLYKWKFHTLDDQLYCITETKETKINEKLSTNFDFSTIYGQVFTTKEEFDSKLKAAPFSVTEPNDLKEIEKISEVPGSNFHELLSNLDGGFKPLTLIDDQSKIESTGSIKYGTPNTENKNSPIHGWYRSPFVARPIDFDISNYIDLANDQRKRSTSNSSIVNVPIVENTNDYTYSAAYELGRLIALDDVDFATELYKWKSEYAIATRAQSSGSTLSYLAVSDNSAPPEIPKHVQDKFNNWKQLKGIPYRYLVPDPTLLPNESIRYFQVDQNWIKAFICGAFSLGHTIDVDFTEKLTEQLSFDALKDENGTIILEFPYYGFLVNSFAVSGWPGYEVEASAVTITPENIQEKNNLISILKREKLDTNIELFLYSEQFNGLNFHLHPGKSYSGFLYEDEKFTKESKTVTAKISPTSTTPSNIIDVSQLATDLKVQSIAEFAGKILEGTPEVIFNLS